MVIPGWFCINGSLGYAWRNIALYLYFAEFFLLFPQAELCSAQASWILPFL